jgi:hypothetical protein
MSMETYEGGLTENERRIIHVRQLFLQEQEDTERIEYASKHLYFLPGEVLIPLSNLKHFDYSFNYLQVQKSLYFPN